MKKFLLFLLTTIILSSLCVQGQPTPNPLYQPQFQPVPGSNSGSGGATNGIQQLNGSGTNTTISNLTIVGTTTIGGNTIGTASYSNSYAFVPTYNTITNVPPGSDIGAVATNSPPGTLVQLGCGGYTVNNSIIISNYLIRGWGDCTVITNNVTLAHGPCFTLTGSNSYLGYIKIFCNTATNQFCAAVGNNSTFLTNAFTNAVIEHVTSTNSTTDGWYVSNPNSCYGTILDCNFQSIWDASAVFLGNHLFRYYNTRFAGIGPSQLAAVAHGFNMGGGGSNYLYSCVLDGENPNSGVGSTNAYAFAMDGNANGGFPPLLMYAELNGCTLISAVNNGMTAYDISNGHDSSTNGTLIINGCNFNPLKTFGPYSTSWLTATGGVVSLVNTNQLIGGGAGDSAVNVSYYYTNTYPVAVFTNSSGYSVSGVSGHWTNYDSFMTINYVNTSVSPTGATWVVVGDIGPAPKFFWGFTLTNTMTIVGSNINFSGGITAPSSPNIGTNVPNRNDITNIINGTTSPASAFLTNASVVAGSGLSWTTVGGVGQLSATGGGSGIPLLNGSGTNTTFAPSNGAAAITATGYINISNTTTSVGEVIKTNAQGIWHDWYTNGVRVFSQGWSNGVFWLVSSNGILSSYNPSGNFTNGGSIWAGGGLNIPSAQQFSFGAGGGAEPFFYSGGGSLISLRGSSSSLEFQGTGATYANGCGLYWYASLADPISVLADANSNLVVSVPFFSSLKVTSSIIATGGFQSKTNNGLALNSITFPNTTVNWTNTNAFNIVMYIDFTGVTGTIVKKNGTQISSSIVAGDLDTILMKTNDFFSVTYTIGTPVGKWEPE